MINKEKLLIKYSWDNDKPFYNLRQSIYKVTDAFIKNRLIILFTILYFGTFIYLFSKIKLEIFFVFLSLIGFFIGLVYILKYQRRIENFKRNYQSDVKEVKLNLEYLEKQGFKIYYNIATEDSSIDYVIVGTKGIFVIKIEAYTKPIKGLYKIVYDGNIVSCFDGISESDILIRQAKNSARWLKDYLKETIQKDFNIFPIVVFVGWYTKSNILLKNIWILNPEGLAKFIQEQKHEFFSEDLAFITKEMDIFETKKQN